MAYLCLAMHGLNLAFSTQTRPRALQRTRMPIALVQTAIEAEPLAGTVETDGGDDDVEGRPSKYAWKPPPRRVKLSPRSLTQLREALDAVERVGGAGKQASGTASKRRSSKRRARPTDPPHRIATGGPLVHVRRTLPIWRHRGEVLSTLRQPVSIVQGETGCGKGRWMAS